VVLDTSAFLAGFDPFSISEEQVTAPKVEEEIRENSLTFLRFRTAVENGRVKIIAPSEEYLAKVTASATTVGDSFLLSETDMQILALALEYEGRGFKPQIITDDYSIQNVAIQNGIGFASLATFGIRRLLNWIRYCPACHKKYPADYSSKTCEICGTKLKRKPTRDNRDSTRNNYRK
jgi:UPF0271 protein